MAIAAKGDRPWFVRAHAPVTPPRNSATSPKYRLTEAKFRKGKGVSQWYGPKLSLVRWEHRASSLVKTYMKTLSAWLLVLALLPCATFAKRAAPAKVQPVVHEGIRYLAPNDDGRRGYIEAWAVPTNKKLWDVTVFKNRIDPKLEEDVQWVFIQSLRVMDGTLVVTSELGKTYKVNLKTQAVTQSVRRNPGTAAPARGFQAGPGVVPR